MKSLGGKQVNVGLSDASDLKLLPSEFTGCNENTICNPPTIKFAKCMETWKEERKEV